MTPTARRAGDVGAAVGSDPVSLHVNQTTVDDGPVVTVEGTVDVSSLGVLQNALGRAIQQHAGRVVTVDLDGLTAIDDCGLGVLLGAAATARRTDGDLRLVVADGPLRQRLAQTRLDRAVDVTTTIA